MSDKNIAKAKLKSLMSELEIGTGDLATMLISIGVAETKSSVDSKISRGTFSADFFLKCLSAMNITELEVEKLLDRKGSADTQDMRLRAKRPRKVITDSRTGVRYLSPSVESSENQPTVVSLFSGAGGFDIGLEQAGFKTIACIDFDADCRETLEANRPEWLVIDGDSYEHKFGAAKRAKGDIRSIGAEEVLSAVGRSVGEIDLVVGGAPCQPFSNMGKKHGKDDERNGDLFLDFVRFVKELQPKAFIFENVVGITQGRHNEVISYMKEQFRGMNFGISHAVLNAANYGVPQRRERFFLIGIKGTACPAFPLPTHFKSDKGWHVFTSGFDFVPPELPARWKTVADAFDGIPANRRTWPDYVGMGVSEVVANRMKYVGVGQNFKVVPPELLPNCWKSGKHLGSDTFGRLDPNQPSVTIRTAAYNPSKGRYIHPFEDRGLDTVEMASLQDFPSDWRFHCRGRKKVTLVSGGKQIGNAVPPGLAKAIGIAIKAQI
ncbi:DNA cytosine methyltransferase [Pseudopelagicola sp. nBUS_19]|uniref:DNA cytosine methyltransferase n=1 Tax=unclassified Pseudopelagicola TaxID=2649563 RepID=UPI003EBAF0E0